MFRMYLIILSALVVFGIGGFVAFADHPLEQDPVQVAEARSEEPKKDATTTVNPLEDIDISKMRLKDGRYREELEDGRLVTFTVDPVLQSYADEILETYKVPAGAAVILNSRTGRVLALAQRREVDEFASIPEVALDPTPPAASLFKIVTAAALLENGGVSPGTETCYWGGSNRLYLENLEDPPKGKGACVSLEAAFGRSINAVFAKLSDRELEPGVLKQYAERFKFNIELPFDVPFEASTAEIPEDRLERARTAAGFWHTHLSPLHAATIVQSLAQKGAMLRPYIVEKVETRDGETLHEATTEYLGHVVSKETAKTLMDVMTHTVSKGTARKAFRDDRGMPYLPGIEVAGKTGTLNGKNPYRAYTWFAGAAPADKPEISIAVLVVNDPKWRIKASGAAALLLKKYFEQKEKDL